MTLGEQGDVFADSNGNYTFTNVPNGTFTVVPFKAGYTFTPTSPGHVTSTAPTSPASTSPCKPTGLWSCVLRPRSRGRQHGHAAHRQGADVFRLVHHLRAPSACGIRSRALITLVPNPYYNLFCSGHSQLADGRILVVGGYDRRHLGAANANIFDPVTLTWSALPNMAYRRWYPTSTTLPDGRALITSGAQTCLTCLADVPEIFDPATNTFTTLPTARLRDPVLPVHVRAARRHGHQRRRERGYASNRDARPDDRARGPRSTRTSRTATARRCTSPARS